MELWKVERFCESATLEQLRAKYDDVSQALLQGQLEGTNAPAVLRIIRKHIANRELKVMFPDG
jgi:hypothetical protein